MGNWEECVCGKRIFRTEKAADDFLITPYAIKTGLSRSYRCSLNKERKVYHVTKQKYGSYVLFDNPKAFLTELRIEVATIKQFIVEFMEKAYKERNVVEFKTEEIKSAYMRAFPGKRGESVSSIVSQLKQDNVIVDLNKPVPGQSRGTFFTLAKILDKETNPVSKTVAVPNQPSPKPTPNSVVANPFDKVNARLDEMLTIVKGLAQGYGEMAKRTPGVNQAQAILDNTDKILREIRAESKHVAPVEIKADIIADAVNLRLTDLTKEDALIYRIREEVAAITDAESKWIVENIQVPEGVSNQNDYREGIREGIRLASEMNLVIRKVKD